MSKSPPLEVIGLAHAAIRMEIKLKQKESLWNGGTIGCSMRNFYANVGPKGDYKLIYSEDKVNLIDYFREEKEAGK